MTGLFLVSKIDVTTAPTCFGIITGVQKRAGSARPASLLASNGALRRNVKVQLVANAACAQIHHRKHTQPVPCSQPPTVSKPSVFQASPTAAPVTTADPTHEPMACQYPSTSRIRPRSDAASLTHGTTTCLHSFPEVGVLLWSIGST